MPPSRTGAHDEYLHCRSSHPGSPLSFPLPNRQFMATGSGLMTALRGVEAQFLLQGSVDGHSGDDCVRSKSAILTQNWSLIVCLPCPSRSPPILPKSGEVLENILSPKRCLLEITFFASLVVTFRTTRLFVPSMMQAQLNFGIPVHLDHHRPLLYRGWTGLVQ